MDEGLEVAERPPASERIPRVVDAIALLGILLAVGGALLAVGDIALTVTRVQHVARLASYPRFDYGITTKHREAEIAIACFAGASAPVVGTFLWFDPLRTRIHGKRKVLIGFVVALVALMGFVMLVNPRALEETAPRTRPIP